MQIPEMVFSYIFIHLKGLETATMGPKNDPKQAIWESYLALPNANLFCFLLMNQKVLKQMFLFFVLKGESYKAIIVDRNNSEVLSFLSSSSLAFSIFFLM